LDKFLQNDIQSYSVENIAKAEGILLTMKTLIKENKKEDLSVACTEFYKCIPHKSGQQKDIKTLADVSEKASLCQVYPYIKQMSMVYIYCWK